MNLRFRMNLGPNLEIHTESHLNDFTRRRYFWDCIRNLFRSALYTLASNKENTSHSCKSWHPFLPASLLRIVTNIAVSGCGHIPFFGTGELPMLLVTLNFFWSEMPSLLAARGSTFASLPVHVLFYRRRGGGGG